MHLNNVLVVRTSIQQNISRVCSSTGSVNFGLTAHSLAACGQSRGSRLQDKSLQPRQSTSFPVHEPYCFLVQPGEICSRSAIGWWAASRRGEWHRRRQASRFARTCSAEPHNLSQFCRRCSTRSVSPRRRRGVRPTTAVIRLVGGWASRSFRASWPSQAPSLCDSEEESSTPAPTSAWARITPYLARWRGSSSSLDTIPTRSGMSSTFWRSLHWHSHL